jgi:hypothetical protein
MGPVGERVEIGRAAEQVGHAGKEDQQAQPRREHDLVVRRNPKWLDWPGHEVRRGAAGESEVTMSRPHKEINDALHGD